MRAYIDVGRQEGILEKEEEKLLLSIVDFGDTRVREVMTPAHRRRLDRRRVVPDGALRPLRRVQVLAHPGRAGLDRHGASASCTSRTRSRRCARARSGRSPELMREAYFVPGDEEGLRAAARVPAPPPLDGDRRGRVRRRVGPRDRRRPPRGDRRARSPTSTRTSASRSPASGDSVVLGLRQGEHRGHPGPLRPRARGGGVHDGGRLPGEPPRPHPEARRDLPASRTCGSPSRKPTGGACIA